MQITNELLKYLEKLSRIELTDEQRTNTKKDLQDILSYVDILNELDTTDVEPLSHSFPMTNAMREDVVKSSAERDLILSNAPKKSNGCFVVHKTVE